MSVRRLADEAVQPASFKFNRAKAAEAKTWLRKYPRGREHSAVIPLLMLAQEQEGWVTRAAIEHVAEMLAMPLIRVLEVATFYTQFQLKPVGTRAHIQVCGTTPCMLRGSEELIKLCRSRISANQFEPNSDGTLSWEEVECLGACVNAPMVMIFKDTFEDLTPERFEEIIDAFEAGRGGEITPGPQNGRMTSSPVTGLTTLTGASGPTLNLAKTAKSVRPAPAAEQGVSGGNPTMALAATASGKAKPKPDAIVEKNRPASVEKTKTPDDLKLISGIGPKLEARLNGLGIYYFSQIAGWKKAERDWVDNYLDFKGRIERDGWVKQAKSLSKGGKSS